MEQPGFSVLIANYNNGRFLEDCFESLVNQTFRDFEVVFVDDASTDNSISIVESFQDKLDIRLAINEVNRGQGFSKFTCFRLAQGALLGLLDPDDALTPDALEIMAQAHADHTGYSVIYSNHCICDENLTIIHEKGGVGQLPQGESQLTYQGNKIHAFATYKRTDYLRTGGIDNDLQRAPDQDLYAKLEELAPVLFIDKSLYLYRRHQHGLSTMGDNIFVASMWKNLITMRTYQRRKNREDLIVPKISYRKYLHNKGNYFVKKSYWHLNRRQFSISLYFLLRSVPFIPLNKQLFFRLKLFAHILQRKSFQI